MFDLHLHSIRSDGQLTPLQLAERAIAAGVSGFSITDHNYLSIELTQVALIADRAQVIFLPGVEISSKDYDNGLSWHVLGYGRALNTERINAELSGVRDGYNRRAKNIIAKLQNEYPGLQLNFTELLEQSESSFLHRNFLAQKLKDYLSDGRTLREILPEIYAPEKGDWLPSTIEAIRLITNCGGQAVLAHPGRKAEMNSDAFENFIKQLAATGLAGLEAYYAKHDEQQIKYLADLAKRYGLCVTGGSDWHGPDYSVGKKIGCLLPENEFHNLLAVNKKPAMIAG